MPRTLSKEQRIFVLKRWWISGKASQIVNGTFRNEFSGEEVSTRQTMSRLAKGFDETSSIEDVPRSDRPVTVREEENGELVSRTFHSNPRTSQRRASHDLNISYTSLQRLMQGLILKPYKPKTILIGDWNFVNGS